MEIQGAHRPLHFTYSNGSPQHIRREQAVARISYTEVG